MRAYTFAWISAQFGRLRVESEYWVVFMLSIFGSHNVELTGPGFARVGVEPVVM